MKKTLQFIAHLIALIGLFALWYFLAPRFLPDSLFLLIFGVCFVLAPLPALFRFSRFSRGFLYGFSIFSFSAGIPAAKALGGATAASVMLTFGLLAVSLLRIQRALPQDTDAEAHLILRGMPRGRARRKLLTKQSYAFFFLYASPLTALLSGWLLFIRGTASASQLFSLAALSVLIGFVGFLLYCMSGGPAPRPSMYRPKKSRKVLLWIFLLCLVIIVTYVYTGQYYTAPEPEFADALAVIETVFTPALIATFAAFLLGAVLGLLLSFCGARLFYSTIRGVCIFPSVLLSGILALFFPAYIAIALSYLPIAAKVMLESRIRIRPFRQAPPQGRKKAVFWPLLYRPTLATLPFIGASSLFTSVVLCGILSGDFEALSSPALLFAASVLAVTGALLYGICFLVKEAKHHG